MEKKTIGQTVYEQLQEMLNEENVRNRIIKWIMSDISRISVSKDSDGMIYAHYYTMFSYERNGGEYEKQIYKHSIHDLFSKDSGIMERIERREIEGMPKAKDKKSLIIRHYRAMCMLTAEEKCKYFVNNARILPK